MNPYIIEISVAVIAAVGAGLILAYVFGIGKDKKTGRYPIN